MRLHTSVISLFGKTGGYLQSPGIKEQRYCVQTAIRPYIQNDSKQIKIKRANSVNHKCCSREQGTGYVVCFYTSYGNMIFHGTKVFCMWNSNNRYKGMI